VNSISATLEAKQDYIEFYFGFRIIFLAPIKAPQVRSARPKAALLAQRSSRPTGRPWGKVLFFAISYEQRAMSYEHDQSNHI
jgi:hypothetical protein